MQDSEGVKGDVEVDDSDFDYENVEIQGVGGAEKYESTPLKNGGNDSDFL